MTTAGFNIEILSETSEVLFLRVTDTIENAVFEMEMFGPYSGLAELVEGEDTFLTDTYLRGLIVLVTEALYEDISSTG